MRDSGAVVRTRQAAAPGRRRGGVRGRVRRTPLLVVVLVVGVVGAAAIFALEARPDADAFVPVAVSDARVGTAYAFDGVLCLDSPSVDARVLSVEVEQAPGGTTRVLEPPEGARTTLGFPVDDAAAGTAPEDYRVPAGEQDCDLRLLVTPTELGTVDAGTVRVQLGYGPFGLLRRTAEVEPPVVLEVTGTGTDPRSSLS